MSRSLLRILALCATSTAYGTPAFVSGDLFWASQISVKLYDIKSGGSQANLPAFAQLGGSQSSQAGQIAFSQDLSKAFVSIYSDSQVLAVDGSGNVTTFATGIAQPTGLLMTSSGRLLVSTYNSGRIYDITDGGDFSAASPYASGLLNPRTMIETASGVLLADQGSGKILNIGNGGDLSGAAAFAWGLAGPADLAVLNGRLYASAGNSVIDVTSGGNMSAKTAFASGRPFSGLASDGTRLLAASDWSLTNGSIWDITAGGNYASRSAWATNLPGAGDTIFDFVPAMQTAMSPTPEPGTLALMGLGLVAICIKLRS